MVFIYIRHFTKEYGNRQSLTYPYDPNIINDHGIISKFGNNLVKEYGMPHIIFTSPYKRTRQTAHLLKTSLDVPIVIDKSLSEFIHSKYNVSLKNSVRKNTYIHCPPVNETSTQFSYRLHQHEEKVKELPSGVYWFVTHGLNIKKLFNIEYPHQLDAIVADNDYHLIKKETKQDIQVSLGV
jgi:hypothetical protein